MQIQICLSITASGWGRCGIKKCLLKLHVWLGSVETYWSLSAGVFCHVFSPIQKLPWELALPLRSSSSEHTVACPWEMLLLGFPVWQEKNAICWIKLIMPARHCPLLWMCVGKIQIHMNNLNTHSNKQWSWCVYPMSTPFISLLLISFKFASITSVTQSKEKKS